MDNFDRNFDKVCLALLSFGVGALFACIVLFNK